MSNSRSQVDSWVLRSICNDFVLNYLFTSKKHIFDAITQLTSGHLYPWFSLCGVNGVSVDQCSYQKCKCGVL